MMYLEFYKFYLNTRGLKGACEGIKVNRYAKPTVLIWHSICDTGSTFPNRYRSLKGAISVIARTAPSSLLICESLLADKKALFSPLHAAVQIAPVLERLPGGTRHWFMAQAAAAPHVHSQIRGVMPPPPKIPSHHPPPYPLATTLGGMTCLSCSVTSVLLKFQELAGTLTIQDNKPAQQQLQNNGKANNLKCRSSHESEHDFMRSGHAFWSSEMCALWEEATTCLYAGVLKEESVVCLCVLWDSFSDTMTTSGHCQPYRVSDRSVSLSILMGFLQGTQIQPSLRLCVQGRLGLRSF